jgi:predicted metal-dependent hydrolase
VSTEEHIGHHPITPRRVNFDWYETPLPWIRDEPTAKLLGEKPPFGPVPTQEWLRFRLAIIAAIEQFTAVLGNWVLHPEGLDRADADKVMLDLLRRHGPGEVEHRSVAFDMYQHCGAEGPARYARRIEGMAVTAPVLLRVWGTSCLIRHDPQPAGRLRHSLRGHIRAVAKGLLPTWRETGAAIPRCFRRSYHPSQEGSLPKAVDCLASSPAARAAAGVVGRAALS